MADRFPAVSIRREIERFFDAPTTTRLDGYLTVYVVTPKNSPTLEIRHSWGRYEVTCNGTHGAYLPSLKAAYDDLLAVEVYESVMTG